MLPPLVGSAGEQWIRAFCPMNSDTSVLCEASLAALSGRERFEFRRVFAEGVAASAGVLRLAVRKPRVMQYAPPRR